MQSFETLLTAILRVKDEDSESYKNSKKSGDCKKIAEILKKYIWRNERVYSWAEKRQDRPTKKEYLSAEYNDSVTNRYGVEDKSVFENLFPGMYSFICRGGQKYYSKLYDTASACKLSEDDFVFDTDFNVKSKLVDQNYKLACIKNICVDSLKDMLWITPVRSRYAPVEPFTPNATKLLVFSGYLMVPRGVSTIFSQYVKGKISGNNSLKTDDACIRNVRDELEKLETLDKEMGTCFFNEINKPVANSEQAKCKCLEELQEYISAIIEESKWDCKEVEVDYSLYWIGSPYLVFRRMGMEHEKSVKLASNFYAYLKGNDTSVVLARGISRYSNKSGINAILYYFCAGCIEDMLNEYYSVCECKDNDSYSNKLSSVFGFEGVKITTLNSDNYKPFIEEQAVNDKINCHFAVPFTPDKEDTGTSLTSGQGESFQGIIQESFNSPFWPMILSTTSAGQEGIDLDSYCRQIMHYTVPYSPMAFEQRDGRIDRRKSLSAREKVNYLWGDYLMPITDIKAFWNTIFSFGKDGSGLSPMWSLREPVDEIGLERIAPFLPGTDEYNAYNFLLDVKYQYRKAFGMPNEDGFMFGGEEGLRLNNI